MAINTMEEEDHQQPPKQIKGKDLPGAVNVLPAGLGAVLAKRQSSEFKMEEKGNSMTFSSAGGQQQTFSTIQESSQSAASFKSASTFESKFKKSINYFFL